MAQEYQRTKARKKILLPSGDTIYVPVIVKISFIDPYERYQETEHELDSTDQSNRVVHVDNVHPVPVDEDGVATDDPPTQDTSQDLYVERIDTWNALDPYERHQETQLTLDNATGNDQLPPHFSNHERTHIYRYHKDPQNPDDDGVWVDVEWIDDFIILDPYERYQEKHYTLTNPTNEEFRGGDLSGQANDDDIDITIGDGSGEGTEANPVRLDPFQNIVNYNSGETHFYFSVIQSYDTSSAGSDTPYALVTDSGVQINFNPPPSGDPPPTTGSDVLMGAYLATARAVATSRGVFASGSGPLVQGDGPPVSVSPSTFSFAPWQMAGTHISDPGSSFQGVPDTDQSTLDYSIGLGFASSVVGPPLIVNGQEIPGFIDTLTATLERNGAPFKSGPYTWSALKPFDVIPSSTTWWNYTGGIVDPSARTTLTDVVATVSGSTFQFNGQGWRAVGLSNEIDTDVGAEIEIYCVRV